MVAGATRPVGRSDGSRRPRVGPPSRTFLLPGGSRTAGDPRERSLRGYRSRPAICEVIDSSVRAEREGHAVAGVSVAGGPAEVNRHIEEGVAPTGKRILDLALALGAMLIMLPVLVIAAVAITVECRGPAFIRERRVGRHGEVIRMWKLRTTSVDAVDGTRMTRVGRVLRRTGVDELPQLFNVISGEMSIVGPRPLVEGEEAKVVNSVGCHGLVKPGITGLWQVPNSSDTSEQDRIRLDRYYVDNWSPARDVVIVWRAIGAALKSEGAC